MVYRFLICCVGFSALSPTPAFATNSLQQQILAIAANVHGKVSVACSLPHIALDCDVYPDAHPPMQSIFKLPLGVTVMHTIEQGKLSLDQPLRFLPTDRILPETHSPLQDMYPKADVDVPVRELLRLAIIESDNDAADILLRTIGGPSVVNNYMASLGVNGFHLEVDEQALDRSPLLQYRDWFSPNSAVALLVRLSQNSALTPDHSSLLRSWMERSIRPRLGMNLPAGTIVAHRTGTSGIYRGLNRATNDMALVTLPNGKHLAIAVFITDASESMEGCETAIAQIGRAIYDAALNTQ